jgi:hypothetical protein
MTGGGGNVIALPMTLLAGLLMFSSVQANDIANGSKSLGFLFKYMSSRSESSKSSIGDNGKFMAYHLNHMELGGRPKALSDQYGHPLQEKMDFTVLRAAALSTSKDFKPQKFVDKEEDKDVQQLFTNETNKPIGNSAWFCSSIALMCSDCRSPYAEGNAQGSRLCQQRRAWN